MLPPVQNHRNKQPRSPTTPVIASTFALFFLQHNMHVGEYHTEGKPCHRSSYQRDAQWKNDRAFDSRPIEKAVSKFWGSSGVVFIVL